MKKHIVKVLLTITIGLILSNSVSFLEREKNVVNNEKENYISLNKTLKTDPPGPPPPWPPGGDDII